MAHYALRYFALFLTLIVYETVSASDRIPVLLWTSGRFQSFAPVLAGHTVNQDDFRQLYLNKQVSDDNIKTIVVFLQDEFSADEISINGDVYDSKSDGGAFKHTKEIMSELVSSYLPSVDLPASVVNSLKSQFPGKTYSLESPFQLSALSIDTNEKKLVIIHLPKRHKHEAGLSEYLHDIDDIVNNVTSQLHGFPGEFYAVYTGRTTHDHHSFRRSDDLPKRRHLLSDVSDSQFVIDIEGVFLMRSEEIILKLDHDNCSLSNDITLWTKSADASCPRTNTTVFNATCTITLGYTSNVCSMPLNNLSFKMTFTTSGGTSSGFWYLETFIVSFENETTKITTTDFYDATFVDWTPMGFSYHCYNLPPVRQKNATDQNALTISFPGFQIQVFNVNRSKGFGYYNDCAGFFTIPIWMAIIVIAVLLSVLFFGIIMLMSIKTMDRFDDAKGKTIQVNVME